MALTDIPEELKGKSLDEQFNILASMNLDDESLYFRIDAICGESRDAYYKAWEKFGERCVHPGYRDLVQTLIKNRYKGPIPNNCAVL